MLIAFNNDQLSCNTSSGMWNEKCEKAGPVQNKI